MHADSLHRNYTICSINGARTATKRLEIVRKHVLEARDDSVVVIRHPAGKRFSQSTLSTVLDLLACLDNTI